MTVLLLLIKSFLSRILTKSIISINVFRYIKKEAYPIYLSKTFSENHMKLLWIENENKLLVSNNLIGLCIIKQSINLKTIFE